jgi:hypothetical protein
MFAETGDGGSQCGRFSLWLASQNGRELLHSVFCTEDANQLILIPIRCKKMYRVLHSVVHIQLLKCRPLSSHNMLS